MPTLTARALGAGRRIAAMTLAEIGYRGKQEGSKWIDRLRDADSSDPLQILRRHAPLLSDPGTAAAELRRHFDQHFFAGAGVDHLPAHRQAEIDRIIDEAEQILAGRFDLLGYRGLTFGSPIDWHLDPVWSRRSPLTHWSAINALDPTLVGDSKVVWELNRHQWMVRLAQASLFSGQDTYGASAVHSMLDWIAANPVGRGINWASSLEVAFRLISWTWVLGLLRHTSIVSPAQLTTILASIHAHAGHVQRYLSYYYSPNTHLTGEALGLLYAGTMYPQFNDATQWRTLGSAILESEADRQIADDGVYFEQSACYQRYTCDIYLQFLLLSQRTGNKPSSRLCARVGRMAEFLSAVCSENGVMPGFGDADGGWLMPLSRREGHDCRGTLAVAAAVLDRPELAPNALGAPEVAWLTGRHASTHRPAVERPSRIFRDGGYAILRAGEHELLFDVGPIGSFGHGHADLLSIQCRIFGEPCLVDAGTYGYTAEPEWRTHFRGSAAHNTITIDQRSQAEPAGPFGWHSRPSATVTEWQALPDLTIAEAEHCAYHGVTHRRRVIAIRPGVFVIIDDLLGSGARHFELVFQFAPMPVSLTGLTATATTPGGRSLVLTPCSSTPLQAAVMTGSTNPIRGWVSSDYGRRTAAPAVIYSATATLPTRIVTILSPQA